MISYIFVSVATVFFSLLYWASLDMSVCQYPCMSMMVVSTGDVPLLTTCKPKPQNSTFLAGELSSPTHLS